MAASRSTLRKRTVTTWDRRSPDRRPDRAGQRRPRGPEKVSGPRWRSPAAPRPHPFRLRRGQAPLHGFLGIFDSRTRHPAPGPLQDQMPASASLAIEDPGRHQGLRPEGGPEARDVQGTPALPISTGRCAARPTRGTCASSSPAMPTPAASKPTRCHRAPDAGDSRFDRCRRPPRRRGNRLRDQEPRGPQQPERAGNGRRQRRRAGAAHDDLQGNAPDPREITRRRAGANPPCPHAGVRETALLS